MLQKTIHQALTDIEAQKELTPSILDVLVVRLHIKNELEPQSQTLYTVIKRSLQSGHSSSFSENSPQILYLLNETSFVKDMDSIVLTQIQVATSAVSRAVSSIIQYRSTGSSSDESRIIGAIWSTLERLFQNELTRCAKFIIQLERALQRKPHGSRSKNLISLSTLFEIITSTTPSSIMNDGPPTMLYWRRVALEINTKLQGAVRSKFYSSSTLFNGLHRQHLGCYGAQIRCFKDEKPYRGNSGSIARA